MQKKVYNYLLIILFGLSILLPLAFSDKRGGKLSPSENRFLASFPVFLQEDGTLNSGGRMGLENWIADNSGGREIFLKLNKLLSYKLFHVFPLEDVVEGKESWLYLIPAYDIANYTNSNSPTQSQIDFLATNFTRISTELDVLGVEHTVMIWPNKYMIYPEYFPNTLSQVKNETALVSMEKALSENPGFDFETAYGTLISLKADRQNYYKAYDYSHWNQYGAFLGYTTLMVQAKRHLPELKILTEDDFNITPEVKKIDLFWGFHAEEPDWIYSLINGHHAASDLSFFNTFGFTSNDPWKSYNYYKNIDDSLPKAIIIGDSFTWMFLLPNIAESFSELVFLHYSDLVSLDPILHILEPDIVMMTGLGPGSAYVLAKYSYGNPQKLNATITSDDTPRQMLINQQYKVNITVKNIGTRAWTEQEGIRLCIFVNGQDLGFRALIPPERKIMPGETVTFFLAGMHYDSKSDISIEYQMVEEGIQYFGGKKRVEITVK